MTLEQLREIEARWARDKKQFGARNQDFEDLLAEVRRLNRMVDRACEQMAKIGIGCPASVDVIDWPDCDSQCDVGKDEADCWRRYLEADK